MLTSLRLENFKGFRDATLKLGPLSLVIGANASGKSNLRDALRFLHGVARGYNLAEILGEKYGEGGYREWSGIRGGVREVCREGTEEFALTVTSITNGERGLNNYKLTYHIAVRIEAETLVPILMRESLHINRIKAFDTREDHVLKELANSNPLLASLGHPEWMFDSLGKGTDEIVRRIRTGAGRYKVRAPAELFVRELSSMRFPEFSPDAMRHPALASQLVLGDQGENLSPVLQAICADDEGKARLATAIQDLTPMDVADFDFIADAQGKLLVHLVEKSGRRTSAHNASDGTLRFLGILAALLGPRSARFYFFEELEVGVHPSRLHLLLDLLQGRTAKGNVQVCATTHSPQLLRLLDEKGFADSSLAYRVEGVPETRLHALLEVPHLSEVLKGENADIARLYEGGWMEQTMFFEEGEPEPFDLDPTEEMPT